MTIEIKEALSKSDLKKFVDVPWHIYDLNDPGFVPPLRMAVMDLLDKKHPFYETGVTKSWLAYKDGKLAGRIMAVNNKAYNKYHEDNVGFFGFFESIEDEEVSNKLFDIAEAWLKEQGLSEVIGPMNPSTNYECGMLVDGFIDPPQIMMTYNPKYYDNMVTSRGYAKAKDLLAYSRDMDFTLPEVISKIAARAEKKNKITYRYVSKKDWSAEIDRMLDIYNDAWEKNWGFVPMTDKEFQHTAKDLKQVVDERLVIFAEVDGDPAGFVVGLPDLHQVLKKIPTGKLLPFGVFKILNFKKHVSRFRVPTMGVKQKYRKLGLEALLYQKIYETARELGYKEVESSWILEDNLNMNKPLIRMGMEPYKTYRIYSKSL